MYTDRLRIEYPHEPLYPAKELVKLFVVGVCADLAHSRRVFRDDNATSAGDDILTKFVLFGLKGDCFY